MKIYIHDHGVIISGKAWEVRQKLKEYGREYQFLSDWIENHKQPPSSPSGNSSVFKLDPN